MPLSGSPAQLPRPARCLVLSLPSRDPFRRSGAAYVRRERARVPAAWRCRDQSGRLRTLSGCEEKTGLPPRRFRSAPPLHSGAFRNLRLRFFPWRLPSTPSRPGASTGQRTCRVRNPKNFAWMHDITTRNSRHVRNWTRRNRANVGNKQKFRFRNTALRHRRLSGPCAFLASIRGISEPQTGDGEFAACRSSRLPGSQVALRANHNVLTEALCDDRCLARGARGHFIAGPVRAPETPRMHPGQLARTGQSPASRRWRP